MNYSLFLVLLSLSFFAPEAQAQKAKRKKIYKETLAYFQQGYDYLDEGNVSKALEIWKDIVNRKMGQETDIYGCSFYNIPTIYFHQEEYDLAEEWYKKILVSDLKDNEETGQLMEPHANYKHKSAFFLSEIAIQRGDYAMALAWLEKADKLYPYWGFEGSYTNIRKKQAFLKGRKLELLKELGNRDVLVHTLLTDMLIAADRAEQFPKVQAALLEQLYDSSFKRDLDEALKDLQIVALNDHQWEAHFELYHRSYRLLISDQRLPRELPQYQQFYWWEEASEGETPSIEVVVALIKRQPFYRLTSY